MYDVGRGMRVSLVVSPRARVDCTCRQVAGSYENEVLAVRELVSAARSVAAAASPHNLVDYDVFTASGAFSLTFLDGNIITR